MSSQEGDPIIAAGAGGVVGPAHEEMPGKLSAEPRAAERQGINDAAPERKPGTPTEAGGNVLYFFNHSESTDSILIL